jgi:ABC-type sugar transport system permease subunit
MKFPNLQWTFNSAWRRAIFVTLPALILLVDFVFFPVLLETYSPAKTADITDLLFHKVQRLGNYKGHQVSLSLDDLSEPQFLNHLKEKRNGLVVSVFKDDSAPFARGALLRAVMQKLKELSPPDHRKLVDRLQKRDGITPGEVISFPLNLSGDKYAEFPLNFLFILAFEHGNVEEDQLTKGIKSVFAAARQEGMSNLILPCLGISSGSRNFEEFFRSVFAALTAADGPVNVYLSLYAQWPTFVLEEAVAGLNGAWETITKESSETTKLYRRDLRLTLLFLIVCVFVSSFFARLTIINFLLISLGFAASGTAANKALDFFAQGYPSAFRSVLQILILMILALGFPFIVNLSLQKIFTNEGDGGHG